MSALGGHAFVKMNGIGNEIVVVDMRDGVSGKDLPISAEHLKALLQLHNEARPDILNKNGRPALLDVSVLHAVLLPRPRGLVSR